MRVRRCELATGGRATSFASLCVAQTSFWTPQFSILLIAAHVRADKLALALGLIVGCRRASVVTRQATLGLAVFGTGLGPILHLAGDKPR